MIERLIIAGGRHVTLNANQLGWLNDLLPVLEVVSGGARGVDACGELWANRNGLIVKLFLPDYDLHGSKLAPLRRNEEMAVYSSALAIFPGGSGSKDMFRRARRRNLKIYDFRKGRRGFFE